jgi:ubiquinone biosynthesis monooxygenase Coq6
MHLLNISSLGSHTALQPYARERYLINHTILTAGDKLHKIYTTEFEPIVWARSTGLEIVNELDSLKAAIMMTAGADSQRSGMATGWDAVSKGIQTVDSVARIARTIGGGMNGLLGSGAHALTKKLAEYRKV